MRLHDLRRFASLSKSVRVESGGKTYDLKYFAEPERLDKAGLESAVSEIRGASKSISEGQEQVLRAVESMTEAIYQPVVPEYDAQGRLRGAKRVRCNSPR